MHRLVPALELARVNRGRKVKVGAIAAALRAIAQDGDDEELATAARLVAGEPLPAREGSRVGVGFALVMSAACEAYGLSPSALQARARSLGDLGDAVGELASAAVATTERPGVSLGDVARVARALAGSADRTTKLATLRDAYTRARPEQARYLTKVLLGELRIGVKEGILDEAIASAFGRDLGALRAAAALCPDPGDLAVLAFHDELEHATLVVGSPVAFMLASPIEVVKAPLEPARTVWEDKLDGVRVQVHVSAGVVTLFARGGGVVSAVFPEIVQAFAGVARAIVLDGEILAIRTPDRTVGSGVAVQPRPFQALQARLNRRDPDAALLESTPVALVAFDLLYDGESLLTLSWSDRRAHLETLLSDEAISPTVHLSVAHALDSSRPVAEQVDDAYEAARARGHEGIVLKDVAAPYEAGRRGSAWRKVKRAFATLDVIITRAERGHGRRAKVLSDYTFGVWEGEAIVEIGKAYSGLTDLEIAVLTQELEARTRGQRGAQLLVEPSVVLEVAFDGIQPSTRHPSGFALRFPRIVRVRTDKRPEDADTLATARALFDAQVVTGHREASAAAPAKSHAAKAPRGARRHPPSLAGNANAEQLDLFTAKAKR
jgi:DNA ligase-1